MSNPIDPPPPVDDSKFTDDYYAMLAAADKVQQDIDQANQDYKDYLAKLSDPKLQNPSYALMLLFYFLGASSQTSTALGFFTDKSGIAGDQLDLNSKVTALGNDLSNMTQSNNLNANSLYTFGKDANLLLGELDNRGGNVFKSMDPDARKSVHDELLGIRQEFKLGSAYPNDPTGNNYYFDPLDPTKIRTFAEMQGLLGMQGDPKGATEAAKTMTDNFAANTQTTQTASAVLNNDEKTYTSMQQAIQSFLASIGQWWNTTVKNSTSHMLTS